MEGPKNDNIRATEFKLERYRYILQQLNSLNDNHHKYLTLFQTLSAAVLGAGVGLFVAWRELRIDAETARVGLRGLFGLFLILVLFLIVSLFVSAMSWMDYRREEVDLLNAEVRSGFRKMPTVRNFWRWPEFYLLIFLLLVVVCVYMFLEFRFIPMIRWSQGISTLQVSERDVNSNN